MKTNLKFVAALAAFTAAAFTAHAQSFTAGQLDLVVGFKASSASNDVMIDLGNVNNYTAAGTYFIGNYNTVLSANFGGATWNTSTAGVNWGAAATYKDPNFVNPTVNWVTKQWTSGVAGTPGTANSTAWAPLAQSQLGTGNTQISKAYTGIGTTTVGAAVTIAKSNVSSWSTATTSGASAFAEYNQTLFQNQPNNLAPSATYSASDLYSVGTTSTGASFGPSATSFIGTFTLASNGDLTFTSGLAPIPEPSFYAAILGVATLGFAAIRRRKQQQIEAEV